MRGREGGAGEVGGMFVCLFIVRLVATYSNTLGIFYLFYFIFKDVYIYIFFLVILKFIIYLFTYFCFAWSATLLACGLNGLREAGTNKLSYCIQYDATYIPIIIN